MPFDEDGPVINKLLDLFRRERVTTLFPAIKGELLVIVRADDTMHVTSDLQDRGVDKERFYTVAVLEILTHAHRHGVDPQTIINGVFQLAGTQVPKT
jgi:hypothetical protein